MDDRWQQVSEEHAEQQPLLNEYKEGDTHTHQGESEITSRLKIYALKYFSVTPYVDDDTGGEGRSGRSWYLLRVLFAMSVFAMLWCIVQVDWLQHQIYGVVLSSKERRFIVGAILAYALILTTVCGCKLFLTVWRVLGSVLLLLAFWRELLAMARVNSSCGCSPWDASRANASANCRTAAASIRRAAELLEELIYITSEALAQSAAVMLLVDVTDGHKVIKTLLAASWGQIFYKIMDILNPHARALRV